uniref:NADH dehydrogenase subunit 2 n=1 Tax=Bothriometopus macrocnemis TaxID=475769 RepID=UPI00211E7D72|nr:NADH dehydrogenase subunit 2 [Bothriometopus macrocnemis]UTT72559.1 NADH dehydrogenase subunit 2 [Bothriometopus macrocnemis]
MSSYGLFMSSSFLMFWVLMELVTFFFISIMSESSMVHKKHSWKYFSIQAVGSAWLVLGIMWMSNHDFWLGEGEKGLKWGNITYVVFPLLMKLGMIPFHGWAMELAEGLSGKNLNLFLTLTKIGPMLAFIYFVKHSSNELVMLVVLVSLLASAMAIKNLSFRQFLVLSSIVNLCWIMLSSAMSMYLSVMMMLFYFINLFAVLTIFDKWMHLSVKSFFKYPFPITESQLLVFIVAMISLWGIPPFMMFMVKYSTMEMMVNNMGILPCLIMLLSSMILLITYLSLAISCIIKGESLPSDLKVPPITLIGMVAQVFIIFVVCIFAALV